MNNIEIPNYSYYVEKDAENGEYKGRCVEFPDLSFPDSSRVEALKGVKALVKKTCIYMMAEEEELPIPADDEDTAKAKEDASMRAPIPSSYLYTGANGLIRTFLRMTNKECTRCKGATGGCRFGIVKEVGETLIMECENPACQNVLRIVKGTDGIR